MPQMPKSVPTTGRSVIGGLVITLANMAKGKGS